MKIIITESAKERLFTEATSIDKKRGVAARTFLKALKNALKNGTYEYDENTSKITFDNYEYKRNNEYAYILPDEYMDSDEDKTPIDLHFTKNTVNKYLDDELEDYNNFNDEI